MSKNKKGLNLRTYKRIKAMNFVELSEYMEGLYREGFEAGRKAGTPDVLFRALREALLSTEDIGPTRADAILKKFGEIFTRKSTDKTTGDERLTAKRPVWKEDEDFPFDSHLCCPKCGHPIINQWGPNTKPDFCQGCGQALDWTPEPEKEEPEE